MPFQLSGEAMTRIARGRMLDGDPSAAWRLVAQGLAGIEQDQVADLLEGRKKLVGDVHGMDLVDEDPEIAEEHWRKIRYVYAGRIKVGKQWWRPVAVVKNFGPDDVHSPAPPRPPAGDVLRWNRWWLERIEHYASDNERCFSIENAILFEACEEAPHWWKPLFSTEKAIEDAAEAGRSLERRGHSSAAVLLGFPTVTTLPEDAPRVAGKMARGERLSGDVALDDETPDEEATLARLRDLQAKILAQANGDLFELRWTDDKGEHLAHVPRAPFENHALNRTVLKDKAPPWTLVCLGLNKRYSNDDPYHTDWMVGAGLFDFDLTYDNEPFKQAEWDAKKAVQERVGSFKVAVLGGARSAFGTVVQPGFDEDVPEDSIVVLPSLDPRYLRATLNAAGIVTEEGGALAHIAQIAIERGIPIMREPGATSKYQPGMHPTLNPTDGTITILALEKGE